MSEQFAPYHADLTARGVDVDAHRYGAAEHDAVLYGALIARQAHVELTPIDHEGEFWPAVDAGFGEVAELVATILHANGAVIPNFVANQVATQFTTEHLAAVARSAEVTHTEAGDSQAAADLQRCWADLAEACAVSWLRGAGYPAVADALHGVNVVFCLAAAAAGAAVVAREASPAPPSERRSAPTNRSVPAPDHAATPAGHGVPPASGADVTPDPQAPSPGMLVDQARQLQAIVAAITTRAIELTAQPARRGEAARLLDAATQLLTVLRDRLGRPAGTPSVQLVVPGPRGSAQSFGYATLHDTHCCQHAVFVRLDNGLAISAGHLDDGRPYVEVNTDALDSTHQAADGLPYADVGLNDATLYEHRPDLPTPCYHQLSAPQPEGAGP